MGRFDVPCGQLLGLDITIAIAVADRDNASALKHGLSGSIEEGEYAGVQHQLP
jgi:hypothetical protein